MQFAHYKPEHVEGLKDSTVRFRAIAFSYPDAGAPGVDIYSTRQTIYADGRTCVDELPKLNVTMADESILAAEFPVKDAATGELLGTETVGSFVSRLYSLAMWIDGQQEQPAL